VLLPVEFPVVLLVELLDVLLDDEAPLAIVEFDAGSEGAVVFSSGTVTIIWSPPLLAIA